MKNVPLLILALSLFACFDKKVNVNKQGADIFEAQTIDQLPDNLTHFDTTYVSIYSEIYSKSKAIRFNLTATLSLRNTSFNDTLFISAVDYYNSTGVRVKQYLDQPIKLDPMQTVEYVIGEMDKSGGTGANFIVKWSARSNQIKPIFEGVMISTNGQQGVSFVTQGVSISRR